MTNLPTLSTQSEKFDGQAADFRRQAIQASYDFFFRQLGIDPARAYVTVFRGDRRAPLDQETIAAWRTLGIPDNSIRLGDRDDNWWGPPAGSGHCGPLTELYIDNLKVWNLVFHDYFQEPNGVLMPVVSPLEQS